MYALWEDVWLGQKPLGKSSLDYIYLPFLLILISLLFLLEDGALFVFIEFYLVIPLGWGGLKDMCESVVLTDDQDCCRWMLEKSG
jgi:hypothetical protein